MLFDVILVIFSIKKRPHSFIRPFIINFFLIFSFALYFGIHQKKQKISKQKKKLPIQFFFYFFFFFNLKWFRGLIQPFPNILLHSHFLQNRTNLLQHQLMISINIISIPFAQQFQINKISIIRSHSDIIKPQESLLFLDYQKAILYSNSKLPTFIVAWLISYYHPLQKRLITVFTNTMGTLMNIEEVTHTVACAMTIVKSCLFLFIFN